MRWYLLLTRYLSALKNNFNIVAPFYDALARLVFGYQLELAQQCFLNDIKTNSRVLIVGGGTGRILEWLPQNLNLQIDYVELSERMVSRAKTRNRNGNEALFKIEDVLEIQDSYDVIITNFFLDCFEGDKLDAVVAHIYPMLKEEGLWLVTDFALPMNTRQRVLLWTMHTFFKIVARLDSEALQDIRGRMGDFGLRLTKEAFFSKELIFSAVFKKY